MGSNKSKLKPSNLLESEWRDITWENKQDFRDYVMNYQPEAEGQQLRILLYGQVGAGKSSFVNSIYSILKNRVCLKAVVENSSQSSCTMEYKTYRIPKDSGGFYPFLINDMMGLENATNRKLRTIFVKDVKKAMKGRIKDGYTFNVKSKIKKKDQYYNDNPTDNDKVQVVVCVVDANTSTLLSKEALETIQNIREEAKDLGIPHVAILTKIDETCEEVKKDVKTVYKSKLIQERVQLFSQNSGVPENCIFPLKNYHAEGNLVNNTDVLILYTLRRIIEIAEDSLNIG